MGNDVRVEEIPEDMKEQAQEYHDKLIEAVAETDEDLMMKYLEGEELSKDEIKAALRKATISKRDRARRLRLFLQEPRRAEAA